jgi:hypothetical protein
VRRKSGATACHIAHAILSTVIARSISRGRPNHLLPLSNRTSEAAEVWCVSLVNGNFGSLTACPIRKLWDAGSFSDRNGEADCVSVREDSGPHSGRDFATLGRPRSKGRHGSRRFAGQSKNGLSLRVEVGVSDLSPIADISVSSAPLSCAQVSRVAIVGTGFVVSTTACALLMSGTPAEIVLIHRDSRRAQGRAHDLSDAGAFTYSGLATSATVAPPM